MQNYHQMVFTRELGGAEVVALHLAGSLREKVGRCEIWIPGTGQAAAAAKEMGLPWRDYALGTSLDQSKFRALMNSWSIARLLRAQSPGVVHIHSPYHYGILSHGFRLSGLKNVVHVHIEEGPDLYRWAFRRPPHLIMTCARFLCDRIRSILPPSFQDNQRIVAMPNAVDIERFHPGDRKAAKASFDVSSETLLVLMVANLAQHKGQETAMKAIALLKEKRVPAQLWLAGIERGGKDAFTKRLKKLACELNITDAVSFLGQREDVPQLLRAADCLVLPSTAEGMPLSILEAQATKIPVLASRTAGVPEIVSNGRTGFLIDSDDAAGYAHHLQSMYQNCRPYREFAERAHAAVLKDHTWKSYIQRVWESYEHLSFENAIYSIALSQLLYGIV